MQVYSQVYGHMREHAHTSLRTSVHTSVHTCAHLHGHASRHAVKKQAYLPATVVESFFLAALDTALTLTDWHTLADWQLRN